MRQLLNCVFASFNDRVFGVKERVKLKSEMLWKLLVVWPNSSAPQINEIATRQNNMNANKEADELIRNTSRERESSTMSRQIYVAAIINVILTMLVGELGFALFACTFQLSDKNETVYASARHV